MLFLTSPMSLIGLAVGLEPGSHTQLQ